MKALSLKQPWLNLAMGCYPPVLKSIETRTWSTRYRGTILFCASTRTDPSMSNAYPDSPAAPYWCGYGLMLVDLVDVRPMTMADEARARCPVTPGRFAWILENPRQIVPVKVKGKLGLFDWPVTPGSLILKPKTR